MYFLCALIISVIEIIPLIKHKQNNYFLFCLFLIIICGLFYIFKDYYPSISTIILKLLGGNNE